MRSYILLVFSIWAIATSIQANDNIRIEAIDCHLDAEYCLEIPNTNTIYIFDNAAIYQGDKISCDYREETRSSSGIYKNLIAHSVAIRLSVGFHSIVVKDEQNETIKTVDIEVFCLEQKGGCEEVEAIFDKEKIELKAIEGTAPLELNIQSEDLSFYDFFDNGKTYRGKLEASSYEAVTVYTVSTTLTRGASYSFTWIINDKQYENHFSSIYDLVGKMNDLDKGGNWKYNEANNFIIGGTTNHYAALQLSANKQNIILPPTEGLIASSLTMLLTKGTHLIEVKDRINNCIDKIEVKVK